MTEQVTAICRACYYELRQLCSVVHSLTREAAKTLVHAFISCCLDNCNALLYGIVYNQFQRLQSVQNAVARSVTGSRCSEHITPVLRSLHWLPVRQRIAFKLATLVHKCLNGHVPTYLADFYRQTGDRRSGMRSAETWILHMPRARSTYCDRSFAVAGPSIWNLPPAIRDPSLSRQGFRRLLKTHLFG